VLPANCETQQPEPLPLSKLCDAELEEVGLNLRERLLAYLSDYVNTDEWYAEHMPDCLVVLSNGEPGNRELIEVRSDKITHACEDDGHTEVCDVSFVDLIVRFITCRKHNDDTSAHSAARNMYERWIESAALGIDITPKDLETLGRFFDDPYQDTNVVPFARHFENVEPRGYEGWRLLTETVHRIIEKRSEVEATLECSITGIPAHCLKVPGLVGDIADWINRSAIMPQPEFALMNSIAAVGALAGRRYAYEGEDTRTNIYLLAVGQTGVGKDHSRKQIKKLFAASGLSKLLMGDDVHSRSGLLSALQDHPVKLCHMDEFGKKLEAMSAKSESTAKSITRGLLELTGAANGVLLGDEYADRKSKPRVDLYEPHLCIYATTTPETLTASLTSADTVSGLLNRFVLGETHNPYPDRQKPVDLAVPESLAEAIRDSYAAKPEGTGNLHKVAVGASEGGCTMIAVQATATASGLVDAAYDEQIRHLRKGETTGPLWARYRELVIKLSMIRAIGIDPVAPEISEADARWAQEVVRGSINYMAQLVSRHVADNETERFSKKLLEIIRSAGPDGITKSKITSKTRGASKCFREDAISDLLESGLIGFELRPTATKSVSVYWAR
jgi:hypothetical protein